LLLILIIDIKKNLQRIIDVDSFLVD